MELKELRLSARVKLVAIKKKTRAKYFETLKPGDEIVLTYRPNGGYNASPDIEVRDGRGVIQTYNNPGQLIQNLSNFEMEEIR